MPTPTSRGAARPSGLDRLPPAAPLARFPPGRPLIHGAGGAAAVCRRALPTLPDGPSRGREPVPGFARPYPRRASRGRR